MIDHVLWVDLWIPGPIISENLVARQLKIIAQQYTFENLAWEGISPQQLPLGNFIMRHYWWHQLEVGNVTVVESSIFGSLLRGDTGIDWAAATKTIQ